VPGLTVQVYLVFVAFVNSVFELLGVVPTRIRYSVALLTGDQVSVTEVPAIEATDRLAGALGGEQDCCGGGVEPGEDEGPVGEDDAPPLSLPPHAIVTAAAIAMKNIPARFMPALLGGSEDPPPRTSGRACTSITV
jgi:hypothetical protein